MTKTDFPPDMVSVQLRKGVYLFVHKVKNKLKLSISIHDGTMKVGEQVALYKLFDLINKLLS